MVKVPREGVTGRLRRSLRRNGLDTCGSRKRWAQGLLIPAYGSATVNVTGVNKKGDVSNGSGLLVGPRHILTNAHVVTDMTLDAEFEIPTTLPPVSRATAPVAQALRVVGVHAHKTSDVAVIEVEGVGGEVPTLAGISFRTPEWADEAFAFGYPPVPWAAEAPLVVHHGEVVTPRMVGIDRQEYFLYSATVRPGNSGGPIVGQDGRVIGLVASDLPTWGATGLSAAEGEGAAAAASGRQANETQGLEGSPTPRDETPAEPQAAKPSIAPYYVGIPADEVVQAASDLGLGHIVTWETWT